MSCSVRSAAREVGDGICGDRRAGRGAKGRRGPRLPDGGQRGDGALIVMVFQRPVFVAFRNADPFTEFRSAIDELGGALNTSIDESNYPRTVATDTYRS